ncbi:MAG TPA: RcnB family protein [Caulobacteraceae bacterium]|jgi:Ni/Co efflux regulator RcnB
MKRIAAATLVFCLMSGTSALAQSSSQHHDKAAGPPRGAGPTHGGPPAGPTVHGPVGPGGNAGAFHTQGGPVGVVHPQANPTFQTQGGPTGFQTQDRGFRRNTGQAVVGHPTGRVDQRSFNSGSFRPNFGAPGFRPGGERPRYNPQYFPRTFNLGQRFQWRGGAWRGPRGYYYRPWFYGQVLPFGWFSADYYINDYYDYDLPVPPYGYEWIRNGPDALLVDISSGEVVESVPGVFY